MTYLKTLISKYFESRLTFFPRKHAKSIIGVKVCIKNTKKQVLLIQRSVTDRHSPLLWEFPGGSIKKEEAVLEALKRETLEETNLEIKLNNNTCYIFSDNILPTTPSVYAGFKRYVFIYSAIPLNFDIKLSCEHNDFLWCSVNKALNMPITTCTKEYLLKCVKASY